MFIEMHIIQNFAPSNLNRDDTGAPKDCDFGGYRRARISSQCLKRAIRTQFRDQKLLDSQNLAVRSKRFVEELTGMILGVCRDQDEARKVIEAALAALGLAVDKDGQTQYLLYLGQTEIDQIAGVCRVNKDKLLLAAGNNTGKTDKKAGKEAIDKETKGALEAALDGRRASDLALFGRMLADRADKNVDAAAQVAHAISTHRVSMEFDFYTAVDELKPSDTAGAGMMGTIEFNSACFYRYANLDLRQLKENLKDDDLARSSVLAFVRAAIAAVPTGKQNSMAAHNPPSFVMAVARDAGLWSLANAFVKPVKPTADGDLVRSSIVALDTYWGKLCSMYAKSDTTSAAENGIRVWCASLEDPECLCYLKKDWVSTVEDVVAGVASRIEI